MSISVFYTLWMEKEYAFHLELVISRKITGWVTGGSKLWVAANKWPFNRAAKTQEMEDLPRLQFHEQN